MFDQFRVIVLAFTGKLKTSPTLRRYFWVYLAGMFMAMIILLYNAFMSLNFYREILDRFTPWSSWFFPVLTTFGIAMMVYLLISSLTGTILDYIARREEKTKGHEPMFIAVVLLLVGFLALDVYANLRGTAYVAENSTEAITENRSESLYDKLQAEINEKEATLSELLACGINGYCWKKHLTEDGRTFQRDLTSDISKLREEQKALMASAEAVYMADEKRYATEVIDKKQNHIRLVWFAYPIAILISLIVQHYVDRALHHALDEEMREGNATPTAYATESTKSANGAPIGFSQNHSYTAPPEGNATPRAIPNLTIEEAHYLAKWKEAVELILAGYSNREVIEQYRGPQEQIRGTTIQKIKTVLRAKGALPEYAA